jgi:Fe-S-cluster containining protein
MKPWFKEGLRFGCTECGECCTGSPGYVWITEKEAEEMAQFLGIPLDEFAKKYTRKVGDRFSLKEHPKNYDCVFLKEKRCTLYSARPKQCRTFPWWQENLETPSDWEEASKRCEGINRPDAPVVPLEEIEKHL